MDSKSAIVLASILLASTVYAASFQMTPREALIGTWSTANYFGRLVNPSTGAVVSRYTGKWYSFDADGTYAYAIIGSGRLISGAAIEKGTYEVNGNRLLLHRKTDSFYPHPDDLSGRPMYEDSPASKDITLYVELKGPAEIVIRKEGDAETFRRDPNSR
jgi:hypothetical protein